MTGITYSLLKDKPNTYWSKRSGQTDLSSIHNDSQADSTLEYQTYEERMNILSKEVQSDRNLPLPFIRLSSFLKKIKYVISRLDMDRF